MNEMQLMLSQLLSLQAKAINRREIGNYDTSESITGQSWPPSNSDNPNQRRSPFRQIVEVTIDSAAAPNTNSFPHGLNPEGYIFTRISGAIGNGSNAWLPIPCPGTNQTLVNVDATNVVISNATNAFDGYRGYIVLEYLKS